MTPKSQTPDPRTWTTLDYAAVVLAQALTRWPEPPGIGALRLAQLEAEAFPQSKPFSSKTPRANLKPKPQRTPKPTEPAPHGTDRRYRAGCSCWDCRRAHSATQAAYRASVRRRQATEAPHAPNVIPLRRVA